VFLFLFLGGGVLLLRGLGFVFRVISIRVVFSSGLKVLGAYYYFCLSF
jgi:hypothetical protein